MEEDIIFTLIEKEKNRQLTNLELIASENFVSDNVLNAMGSILTNKYAEGYPTKRYYGGCEIIDEIENICIERIKKIFNVEYANVQAHSGSQANTAVYIACLEPGDKILGFNLSHGGHLTHGAKFNISGKIYQSYFYGVNKETGYIDYNELEEAAKKHKPHIIICGASAYSRDIDYKRIRDIADEINSIILADISHPAGIIACKKLNNPVPYCHIITSTTHKTLRGPRGGIILIGKDFEYKGKLMSDRINSAIFPGIQGGPLENIIAAKAVAFKEVLTEEYNKYILQVLLNSKKLCKCLIKKGYSIITNGTDNHCMLIDLRNKGLTGKEAEKILESNNITCNKNMIPFDPLPSTLCSGIRIGTPAITTRGLNEDDMVKIADWIDDIINNKYINNNKIKNNIKELLINKPLFNK